ncbi:VanZ family protein [Methylibium sp.]|uniref:VanZ family protein n=1 Tax=Methylibium sp. TaxID=2067992 RepID=UPI00179DC9E5|nr:VanZ family protein [Methylibium sp.]MBA3588077.1 VanZ family protein [Methylibium sp.]
MRPRSLRSQPPQANAEITADRSSAWPLAAVCLCVIVYASLHPFSGWRLPTGSAAGWPWLPSAIAQSQFDVVANLLGYLPLGALLAAGVLRDGRSRWLAFLAAALVAGALSYVMESLQHLLPLRVPSRVDWALNTAGAAVGALMAAAAEALGGLARWQRWRERWFLRGPGFGLALLLLWPFGLLFPPPLPFGLGQVLGRVRDALAGALTGTAWDGWLRPSSALPPAPLAPGVELLGIVAGLLAPCLLAFALTRPGARRVILLAGALLLGAAATTLSTVLNFGPDHALTWLTLPVVPGFAVTVAVALPLVLLSARSAAALALPVISLGLALVNLAPADPYYAASLQSWEQGRFIRFHGLSQWIGWLWPWATLVYLIGRVAARDPGET